jgi:hypothetical protein
MPTIEQFQVGHSRLRDAGVSLPKRPNAYRRELARLDRKRAQTLSRILGDLSAAASTIRHALDLIAARGAR